jgi:hypothetical protein
MVKNKLINQIKLSTANKVLYPFYVYLILVVIFYVLRDIAHSDFLNYIIPMADLVIFILPLVLFVLILILFRKYHEQKKSLYIFLYELIPGFLFGFQISYGFSSFGKEYEFLTILPQLLLIGLCGGVITGVIGLLINLTINVIKKN